jgi:peptidoglycan/LPS O-acetylase OafA/YrhL
MTRIDSMAILRRAFSRAVSFDRITTSVEYIPQIDALRFLSMMLIMAHHSFAVYLEQTHRLGTQHLPADWGMIYTRSALVPWALNFAIGVPVFCAISGFVLAIPFARSYRRGVPPPSKGLYFARRLIRIEPPYIVNMIFMFLLIVVPTHFQAARFYFLVRSRIFLPHLLASLTYLHAAIFGDPSWINGVAWTLEIELQFYLLLPFLAELFRVRASGLRRAIFATLILVSALISQFLITPSNNARLNLSLPLQLQFFLAGLLLADVYLDPPKFLRPGPRAGDAMAALSAASLIYVLHWKPALAYLEPFLIAAFFLATFRGRWASRLFALKPLSILGGMCYTVYLYHLFLMHWIMPAAIRLIPGGHALWWDSAVQFALMLPPVFAVSAVFYLFAERPFIVLGHEVARAFRPAKAALAVQV